MKKIIALLLAFVLVLSLAACGNSGEDNDKDNTTQGKPNDKDGESADVCGDYELVTLDGYDHQFKKYANMTDEPITLSYITYDNDAVVSILAEAFMELYPNIKVEIIQTPIFEFADTMTSLANENKLPDVIMYIDADYELSNKQLLDFSGYWNSDEETKALASTVDAKGLGTFNLKGGQRYAAPMYFRPQPISVDLNVLKACDRPAIDQGWSWADLMDLIKSTTGQPDPNGTVFYGLSVYTSLDTLYAIASDQNAAGTFGFNGFDFDPTVWATGEQDSAELRRDGYIAPYHGSPENEEWLGDMDAWAYGHVAVLTEPLWSYQDGFFKDQGFGETLMETYGMDLVPYVVPTRDGGADLHNTPASMDFIGLSAATEHPREAYELMKFMSYGVDGWAVRCGIYGDDTILDGNGFTPRQSSMPAPLTTDQEIWDAYIEMFCDGMDEEHTGYWREYFAASMQPIPTDSWLTIPGFMAFQNDYFFTMDIYGTIESGEAKAEDFVPDIAKNGNRLHAEAMLNYFGPDGYNVLTDEEITSYTELLNANA